MEGIAEVVVAVAEGVDVVGNVVELVGVDTDVELTEVVVGRSTVVVAVVVVEDVVGNVDKDVVGGIIVAVVVSLLVDDAVVVVVAFVALVVVMPWFVDGACPATNMSLMFSLCLLILTSFSESATAADTARGW